MARARARSSARLRRGLVAELERRGALTQPDVRDAFLSVPRELFVPEFAAHEGLEAVYRDEAILTRRDLYGAPTSSSSQPGIMAPMLERLAVEPGHRVLEIGAGTGYNATLLSRLVGPRGRVVSVELDRRVARDARKAIASAGGRVHVVAGDGRAGWPAGAPYDRIVATASADAVPRPWLEQLAEGGLIEVSLRLNGPTGAQAIATLRREGNRLRSVAVLCGGFMLLRARPDDPTPTLPVLTAADSLVGARPLVQLEGESIGKLSQSARRRALATALGDPRPRPLGYRARGSALFLYLSLETPAGVLVASWSHRATGVLEPDGRSLALVRGWERIDRITAYGGSAAEERLDALLAGWRELGCPSEDDLSIDVRFDGKRSRIRWSWRAR